MIRRKDEVEIKINENMRGGDGRVKMESLLSVAEMYEKGRLYSRVTLEPGCSVGYHVHEGEMEAYFILSGKAEYDDNGERTTLTAGDLTYTLDGSGHAIRNIGDETLQFMALILYS